MALGGQGAFRSNSVLTRLPVRITFWVLGFGVALWVAWQWGLGTGSPTTLRKMSGSPRDWSLTASTLIPRLYFRCMLRWVL